MLLKDPRPKPMFGWFDVQHLRPRLAALISGRGSNLEALLQASLPVDWIGVISNRPEALGLNLARTYGIKTQVIDHTLSCRTQFEQKVINKLDAWGVDLVVLAGFMRVLSPECVAHYSGRLINIHPSLLPAFPGLDTHNRALQAGVKIHGCTVHWVNEGVDSGQIIAQAAVPVYMSDTSKTLGDRVLESEHRLYPAVIHAWCLSRLDKLYSFDMTALEEQNHTLFSGGF